MPLVIPLDSASTLYRIQTELEGVPYTFALNYNSRDGEWYMTIEDSDGVAVQSGMRVVIDAELSHLNPRGDGPPGSLMILDSDGSGTNPGRDDLGQRVKLLFTPVAELLEILSV